MRFRLRRLKTDTLVDETMLFENGFAREDFLKRMRFGLAKMGENGDVSNTITRVRAGLVQLNSRSI